jgi:hypothetical protein
MDGHKATGQTTKQILEAPKDAYFIWHNEHLDYPRHLLIKNKRPDIHLVGPRFLDIKVPRGMEYSGIVVDHSCRLSAAQLQVLHSLTPYIRKR